VAILENPRPFLWVSQLSLWLCSEAVHKALVCGSGELLSPCHKGIDWERENKAGREGERERRRGEGGPLLGE